MDGLLGYLTICSKSSVETLVRLGSFCRHTGMFDRLKNFLCFAPSGWSYTMISYSLNLVCLRRSIPMWNTSVSGENTSFLVPNEWVQCNQIHMSAFSAEHIRCGKTCASLAPLPTQRALSQRSSSNAPAVMKC